jgi:diguanylate cyclase (GGDEF)-like protein/PAS domain S-box-containing protein
MEAADPASDDGISEQARARLREDPELTAYVDTLRERADAFEHAPVGLAIVAPDERLLRVNDALCALLGLDRGALGELTLSDLTVPADLGADREQAEELLAGRLERYAVEKRLLTSDGEALWTSLSVSVVREPDGSPRQFVVAIEDASDRKQVEARLRHLADHDELTGLLNRRRFERDLSHQVALSRRYGERAAAVLLDLDHLKQVNDTQGHQAGDALLMHVGRVLRGRLRASDLLARLGGDEFAALLPRVEPEEALKVAQALVDAIASTPLRIDGRPFLTTASAGVAGIDADRESASAVLAAADRALYAAKRTGRGQALLD